MKWDNKTAVIGILCLIFVGFQLNSYYKINSLEKDKKTLQNALADSQATIVIKDSVYMKATKDIENLKSLLDNSNNQVHALTEYIEKQKEKIAYVTGLAIKWKSAYEGVLNAQQHDEQNNPPIDAICVEQCMKLRTRVDFEKELGPFKISGHTITNPAEAYAKVEQLKPLILKLVVTRTKSGLWKTYVVSQDGDLQIQIDTSAIDTSSFRRKWYEKIGLAGNISLGSGIYSSIGVTYDFNGLSVGPSYGFSDRGKLIGLTAIWRPFFSNEK